MLPVLAFSAVMTEVFWNQQRTAFDAFSTRVRGMTIALDRELAGHIRAVQALGNSPLLQAGDLARFYEHARIDAIRKLQQMLQQSVDLANTGFFRH